MALTRLDNLYSSKTGKYLYVSPDDFNATDELDNRGNSPLRPFKTIQRAFIEVARYSFLPAEGGESVPDRFDQFSIMLMPGDHYIDNRPGLVEFKSGDASRYFDAKNRIVANRQEIIDRSFAQIVVDHPDFYVPGDQQTDEGSRYQDAYRFIQKNKQYIVESAVAQVTIDFPDFYFPDEAQSDSSSRNADAYRLIQQNRQNIVDAAWANMLLAYPSANPTMDKCKRDIGILIDYVTLDIFNEGNTWSREFAGQYFDANGNPIADGLVGEETESVYAFNAARDFMLAAMTNQSSVTVNGQVVDTSSWVKDLGVTADPATGDNTDPTSCANVQTNLTNLVGIVTDVITAGNLNSLPALATPTLREGQVKCNRDTGFLIDAVSLDVNLGGGNVYTRKFIQNYFNAGGTSWVDDGLQGEEAQSEAVFNKARDLMQAAITNQSGFPYKDYTITADPNPGGAYGTSGSNTDNTDPAVCSDVQSMIASLVNLAVTYFNQGSLDNFVVETVSTTEGPGSIKCKRDLGLIIDAVAADLGNGGNGSVIAASKTYFDKNGLPIGNGVVGEESQTVTALNAAAEWTKKAVTNQLYDKDLTILPGPASYSGYETNDPIVPNLPSGNAATCVDVQATIDTLYGIITTVISDGDLDSLNSVQVTGDIPVFNYNRALQEWQDNSIVDLSNPDNVLYKFNAASGGAIVPRGCSLIGYDLRRTVVRPLYVPDPADPSTERTSIFNLTGGCYIWQFTIKDGDLSSNSPLYDSAAKVGKVYFQKGNNTQLAIPEYSHHKICIMTYADTDDLQLYYDKVGTAFALFQPTIDDGDFTALPQENRIVGPLSDTRSIINIRLVEQLANGKTVIEATTKVAHGYFKEQYIAIIDTGLNDALNGTFKVTAIDEDNPKLFRYEVDVTPQQLGLDINTTGYTSPDLSLAARAQAEIDSVESASPYVFNCSIRSTWGQCGMWADGSKATGFKSMVVAQYTGVSLQKDDRAFIRYDEFSNTWNQASLTDAFATTAYHTKGDAYWKDDWRNFHIRASDDSFIQCVSVFAVGFFDHFLMESGGDMSITNSNSNFGNTSLHSIGYKGFSFNQDKGGYITDIVPVKNVDTSAFNQEDLKYYPLSNQATKVTGNQTRLYYSGDDVYTPFEKPATSIEGYRLGALTNDKVYLKLPKLGGGNDIYESTVSPSGFSQFTASLETLNPDGVQINNNAQDASNLIETNKEFIQREAYNYIITRYPELQNNSNITISKCERDIGYIVDAVIQDLRLGGNINTIQAAEGYYVGGTLAYIDGEFNESIEAYEYVKNLTIATMRNFDYLIKNPTVTAGSAILDIGSTAGILVGMTVTQYEYNTTNFTNGRLNRDTAIQVTGAAALLPQNAYVRRVIDGSRIEIGNSAPVLTTDANGNISATFGNAVVASNSSTSGAYLYFEFPQTATTADSDDVLQGGYSDINPVRDSSVLQDTSVWDAADQGYPECNDILTLIEGYFTEFFLILNNGLTPLGGTEVDAHNLILANKTFIATEAVERMLLDPANASFVIPGGNQNCIDDVELFLEAIAYNIKYGGNDKVYDGALNYVQQPGLINDERDESVQVYTQMRDLAISAMKNEPIVVQGSHGLTQVIDNNVLGDTSSQPGVYDFANDCADVASSITVFTALITQAIGTDAAPGDLVGIVRAEPSFNVATRVEPVVDTANLASRATLFTINTGGSTSDPHLFETGTPVRLVPKIRSGVDPATVDKRVIRLPKGFDTNTIYYVIAPGRTTEPEDYSDGVTYPNIFEKTNTTKLMLATTKENAAAGIYMYSPETDSVDFDVEIGINQFVLDESYDLHKYVCNFPTGLTDVLETDVPHIFDVPGTEDVVHEVFFRTFGTGSTLPQITTGGVTAEVNTNQFYYVRFVTPKTFAVFNTKAEAVAGSPRITFAPNFGQDFYVFSNKRVSPVRFDPTRDDSALTADNQETTTGQWYIQTTDAYDPAINIQARMNELGQDLKDARSKNTSFKRLKDERTAQDRIYRLRYVIPKYAEGVRDPLNGFVIKARTDETRKLLPQRILLKPTAAGDADVALFETQIQLTAGGTLAQQLGLPAASLDPNFDYDPYLNSQVKQITSDRVASKTAFSIQSARQVDVSGTNYLELTVFDHTITDDSVRNEQFVTVRINAPQGGSGAFRINTSTSNELNKITWNGFSSGFGYVQGYFNPDGTDEHYLVLKGLDDDVVVYDKNSATTFSQPVLDADNDPVLDGNGNQVLIYATLQAKPNSVGSPNDSLSKSDRKDYLYSDKNSNVLTMTPGDIITDDDGNDYEIASVIDAGEIEDTFYIFDIEEVKRRIPNQQEGIYYLTCVKGNVSPFPTGPGVGTNFRGFKFSQPIGQLYPLDYKNDPLWFQIRPDNTRDTTILDTPATVCAADNFIHGLVTTNDYKNSETKEVVLDFIENPALSRYEYTTNKIEAQDGNAASGSEDRLVPISGDSVYPTEKRLYVELRRPSIARSGNHTFEYLGFGPGNYSTGFPLRQEVVLEDIQDFYAQAKREDGGIVFYTGLNSNGDLYIGNRKINAITGEETFLERAELLSSDDDEGDIGGLVTTFELPVAFEQEITVDGNALFNNPVTINVDDNEPNAFTVVSNVDSTAGGDLTLDSSSWSRSTIASEGNVVIHQNQIFSAIYRLNPRGSTILSGQDYSIRTHVDQNAGNTPTNRTPNQTNSNLGIEVKYGALQTSEGPTAGDILLKGEEVGRTGSLGWIYANYYNPITASVASSTAAGGSLVTFTMGSGESPAGNDIAVGATIKISGLEGRFLNVNGIREVTAVTGDSFSVNAPTIIETSQVDDPTAIPVGGIIAVSLSKWTETALIGAETLRTDTANNGDYRLGINTLARSAHSDYLQGFTSDAVAPRANLDVVGTAFISGKVLATNGYDNFPLLANRTFAEVNNALLVGGNSVDPNVEATFRVATTNGLQGPHSGQATGTPRTVPGGRVGINVSDGLANHTLTVVGDARITENVLLEENLAVNGGSLSTTSASFSLLDGGATTVYFASEAKNLFIGNSVSGDDTTEASPQVINISPTAEHQEVNIGTFSDDTIFKVHTGGLKSVLELGTSNLTNTAAVSVSKIGGAYSNESNSLVSGSVVKFQTRFTEVDGDLAVGTALVTGTGIATLSSPADRVNLFTLNTSKLYIGSSVSRMYLGAQGGFTQINNSLIVKSSSTLEGDVTLSGGLNSGEFEVRRGSFSTTASAHDQGDTDNSNVDLFTKTVIGQFIDTDASFYGGTDDAVGGSADADEYYLTFSTPANTTIFEVGAYLLLDRSRLAIFDPTSFTANVAANSSTITSVTNAASFDTNNTWVRIDPSSSVTFNDGTKYAQIQTIAGTTFTLSKPFAVGTTAGQVAFTGGDSTQGDAPVGEQYSELVLVEELTNLNAISSDNPLRVKIKRAMNQRNSDGSMVAGTPANLPSGADPSSFKFLRTDHPDNIEIIRYDLANNVSFIDEVGGLSAVSSGTLEDINTGDFSGAVGEGDILRFTDSELAIITDINTTSPQRFVITDGADNNPVEQFVVDSTNGNTTILGDVTVNANFTLAGSTTANSQVLTITTGGSSPVTTFTVDSATGDTCLKGDFGAGGTNCDRLTVDSETGLTTISIGDLLVGSPTDQKLILQNSTGNLTIAGHLTVEGQTESTIAGPLQVDGGNFQLNKIDNSPEWVSGQSVDDGDTIFSGINIYTVVGTGALGTVPPTHNTGTQNNGAVQLAFLKLRQPEEIFEVEADGSMNFAGQEGFFTPSGARKWVFVGAGEETIDVVSNVNYFVTPSSDTTIKLPQNPTTGDMIRVVDVGGNLTYNISLKVRAPDNVAIQGDNTNSGVPASLDTINYGGGELVVQTPHAGFGLIFLGSTNFDGTTTGAPSTTQGWWLVEI